MSRSSFVDRHSTHEAFLGNRLLRLADLIADQGDMLLNDAGITLPSRASSAVLLLSERGSLSSADIARELLQPHQVVTQRIEALLKANVIERARDPNDKRRKMLTLTQRGRKEAKLLQATLREAAAAFEELNRQLGANLSDLVMAAVRALTDEPLSERMVRARLGGRRVQKASRKRSKVDV